MSKYLDTVIQEIQDYGDMGDAKMGRRSTDKMVNAYRLNDLLRNRTRSEEEEDYDDMGGTGAEDDEIMSLDGEGDDSVEELKQFFIDNPTPADEEIAQYAEERGMDLEEMRQAVYELIQSLLDHNEEGMGDEGMDYGSDEEMNSEYNAADEMDFRTRG